MKDYGVYIYKGFTEDEDFWKKCFENQIIEKAEEVEKNNENEKLKKKIDGAIEWLKNNFKVEKN